MKYSAYTLLFFLGFISFFSMHPLQSEAADMSIVDCRALDSQADCYFLTDIDPSLYDDLGTCTSGRRCMKPKANTAPTCVGTGFTCKTNGCSTSETVDSSKTCGGTQVCCKTNTNTDPGSGGPGSEGNPGSGGPGNGGSNPGSGGPGGSNPGSGGPGSTGGTTGGSQTIAFSNPLQYDTVQDVFGSLLSALQGIIVTLSLIFIVIGALLYITSAGDDKKASSGKSAITAALIGLAIGIAAPSFLKEISGILGWNSDSSAVGAALSLSQIALNVLNFLLGIIGILALIMLVVGASMYLTAAGDEHKLDDAKDMVKYALIGITIAFASMVLVKQIAAFFV